MTSILHTHTSLPHTTLPHLSRARVVVPHAGRAYASCTEGMHGHGTPFILTLSFPTFSFHTPPCHTFLQPEVCFRALDVCTSAILETCMDMQHYSPLPLPTLSFPTPPFHICLRPEVCFRTLDVYTSAVLEECMETPCPPPFPTLSFSPPHVPGPLFHSPRFASARWTCTRLRYWRRAWTRPRRLSRSGGT